MSVGIILYLKGRLTVDFLFFFNYDIVLQCLRWWAWVSEVGAVSLREWNGYEE